MRNDEAVQTIKLDNGRTIRIFYDDDPMSPREDSNIGTMAHWHRRMSDQWMDRRIGEDDIELQALRRGGWPLLARYLRMAEGARVVMPLYLYEHSGMTIRTSAFSDPWDSGAVGFIYDTPKAIKECMGDDVTDDQIRNCLIAEVADFDTYITGQIFGYVVTGIDGQHFESCWGFYSEDDAIAEAKADADAPLRAVEKRRRLIRRQPALRNLRRYAVAS